MAEYIDCEAVYRFAQEQKKKETGAYSKGWNHAMDVIKSAVHNKDAIHAADVVPVVRGRWIKSPECPEEYDICSVCGKNDKHRSRGNWEHDMVESVPPFCKWYSATEFYQYGVTHWMPLPTPPKEETE